jgi:hypothetical protein
MSEPLGDAQKRFMESTHKELLFKGGIPTTLPNIRTIAELFVVWAPILYLSREHRRKTIDIES